MTTNYEHFITKNIKTYYKKRIWAPILYFVICLALWIIFPLPEILSPVPLANGADPATFREKESAYVTGSFTDLTFSGYIAKSGSRTSGYYYYTKWDNSVLIVLLSPTTCEQGLPHIDEITIYGKLVDGTGSYNELMRQLAKDLNWTEDGIISQVPDVFFSQPAGHIAFTYFLFFVYFVTWLISMINILVFFLHILFPVTAPACHNLIVFGHPKRMLAEAEEELATLPQLATEDMFITEHYFIMTSPDANAFVPIDKILWIYKHSSLHKFLWYHLSISYTMHITAKNHLYFHCPKNIKSDIDGIMDYLAEANHDIVVGFSEENRLKVQAEMGKPFHVEKLVALLHKRL